VVAQNGRIKEPLIKQAMTYYIEAKIDIFAAG